jgi:hypothetical protein
MTLRLRIALILAAVAFAVAAAAATVAYVSTRSQLASSIDDSLRSRAAAVNSADGGRTDRGHDGQGGPRGGDGSNEGCPTAGVFQPASGAQLVSHDGGVTACIDGGPPLPFTSADLQLPARI